MAMSACAARGAARGGDGRLFIVRNEMQSPGGVGKGGGLAKGC